MKFLQDERVNSLKGFEEQKVKRTESQKDRRSKGQKNKTTEGQKDRRTKGQKYRKEVKYLMRRNLNSEFQIQIQIVKDTFVQKKQTFIS